MKYILRQSEVFVFFEECYPTWYSSAEARFVFGSIAILDADAARIDIINSMELKTTKKTLQVPFVFDHQ